LKKLTGSEPFEPSNLFNL